MGEIYGDLKVIDSTGDSIIVKTNNPKSPDSSTCIIEASGLTCYT